MCEHVFVSANVGVCVSLILLILSKGVGDLFTSTRKGFIVIVYVALVFKGKHSNTRAFNVGK